MESVRASLATVIFGYKYDPGDADSGELEGGGVLPCWASEYLERRHPGYCWEAQLGARIRS